MAQDKSLQEHGNLLSAEYALYTGAATGGLVAPGRIPPAMLDVAGLVALLENSSPTRPLPGRRPRADEPPVEFLKPAEDPRFVPIVDRKTAEIIWGKRIREQGGEGNRGWPSQVAKQNPGADLLPEGAKTFDLFNETSGEAISAKTIYTLTMSRIRKPQQIFDKLKTYVDAAVNYDEPRADFDIEPALIKSKTIHVAIPEATSPSQWRQLLRGVIYGKENGVTVVITRVRE